MVLLVGKEVVLLRPWAQEKAERGRKESRIKIREEGQMGAVREREDGQHMAIILKGVELNVRDAQKMRTGTLIKVASTLHKRLGAI